MFIKETTGVANPDEFTVTKGIEALLIETDHDPLSAVAIDDPFISVHVEKANGTNLHILTNVRLKNFLLMSTYGASAIHATDDFGALRYYALCELTEGGAIDLDANDTIKIKLTSLDPAKTYRLHGVEAPEETPFLLKYDLKNVFTEDSSRELDVAGYDLMAVEGMANITSIRMTCDNGRVVEYTPVELHSLQVDLDPFALSTEAGVTKTHHPQIKMVPLVGVSSIEIVKPQGTSVLLTLRSEVKNQNIKK